MLKSELKYNGLQGRRLSEVCRKSRLRRLLRQSVACVFVSILMVVVMLATGCASHPLPPREPLSTTPQPVIQSSPPTIPWSQQAQNLFNKWRGMLTSATLTSN